MPAFIITFGSSFEEVDYASKKIMEFISTKCGVSESNVVFLVNFTLRELLNNAVEHGNKLSIDKKVCCKVICEDGVLKFDIEDEGIGFDLDRLLIHDTFEEIDGIRGRGIAMIRKIGFDLKVDRNRVTAGINLNSLNI